MAACSMTVEAAIGFALVVNVYRIRKADILGVNPGDTVVTKGSFFVCADGRREGQSR